MNPTLVPLKRTLDLNTRLLLNALDGFSEQEALARPGGSTNHAAFLACHLVDARHYLARTLGVESEYPFAEQLRDARGLEDVEVFPPLDEIREAWTAISARLTEHLASVDADRLGDPVEHAFPIEGGDTLLGCLVFLVQHDGYHLGQIALLRRFVGLPAMSYR